MDRPTSRPDRDARQQRAGTSRPVRVTSGQDRLGQLGQLPQSTLQVSRFASSTQSRDFGFQVAYSRPQERHLVDETTIRNSTDVAEKGLRHLVSLHTRRFGGSWEGHAIRGRARCVRCA
jgi:hypothetical protein